MQYKIPLVLTPQPEGGYTVTSPVLPELVTEGDSIDEAMRNVPDALAAVIEAYSDLGRPLPRNAERYPRGYLDNQPESGTILSTPTYSL